jgi:hypothetical protein
MGEAEYAVLSNKGKKLLTDLKKLENEFSELRYREKKRQAPDLITEAHEIMDDFEKLDIELQKLKANKDLAGRSYFTEDSATKVRDLGNKVIADIKAAKLKPPMKIEGDVVDTENAEEDDTVAQGMEPNGSLRVFLQQMTNLQTNKPPTIIKIEEVGKFMVAWKHYISTVHSKSSATNKLFLIQKAVENCEELKSLAEQYEITDQNAYENLIKQIENRFLSARKVIEKAMEDVIQLMNSSNRGKNTAKFLTEILNVVNARMALIKSTVRKVNASRAENPEAENESCFDAVFYCLINRLLDPTTRANFAIKHDLEPSTIPNPKQLLTFIEQRTINFTAAIDSRSKTETNSWTSIKMTSIKQEKLGKSKCFACNKKNHSTFQCRKVLRMSIADRNDFIKKENICRNCLQNPQNSCECFKKRTFCKKCPGAHNDILHIDAKHSKTENAQVTSRTRISSFSLKRSFRTPMLPKSNSFYIKSKDKTADEVSRGKNPRELLNNQKYSNKSKYLHDRAYKPQPTSTKQCQETTKTSLFTQGVKTKMPTIRKRNECIAARREVFIRVGTYHAFIRTGLNPERDAERVKDFAERLTTTFNKRPDQMLIPIEQMNGPFNANRKHRSTRPREYVKPQD